MMLNSISIGTKISEARKKINLSQAELAKQISISAQAVGKWERGESMPDISTLNRLAEIFGVDLNYFSDRFQGLDSEATSVQRVNRQRVESLPSKEKKNVGGKWDMSKGNWVDADFSGLNNLQEKFNFSNVKKCLFLEADLSGLLLKSNYIDACDFSGADLRNSKIQTSNVSKSVFVDCSLIDTEFTKSEIKNCDFKKANLSGAEFLASNFQKNLIEMALWRHTSFKDVSISEVVFDGTFEDCSFENCSFKDVKFQNATIKNTFFKHNRKFNRVEFIDCKVDRLTYAFLKNEKANLTGVTLIE